MKTVRGCLHEKTRTGASFIPEWLFDFVSRSHDDWVILYLVIEGTLHVDKIHVWFKTVNIMHTLPVPVYRQTDVTSKRVVVSRLHDTAARFRSGVKFSPRYKNRGDSRRHDILWWYHVNKYRAMRGNWSELAPVSCKHPLTVCGLFQLVFVSGITVTFFISNERLLQYFLVL